MIVPDWNQEEAQADDRGLVLIEGKYYDPETGEEIAVSIPEDEKTAATLGTFRYLSLDGQIAQAKAKKKYWENRVKSLEKRRDWYELWLKPSIVAFAQKIRGEQKKVEIGHGTVVFSESKTGSIKVPSRKEEETLAVEWCQKHCPEALVPLTGFKVSVAALTPEARTKLFSDPDDAKANGFDVEAPGERVKIETVRL